MREERRGPGVTRRGFLGSLAATCSAGVFPLDSIGLDRKDVVELEYFDYARSKYLALGIPDTMPMVK